VASPSGPGARVRVALVLLALASGAADAFAFLLLGGIFTANMTGNLVLAGMFTRPGWPATLAGAVTAVVVFAGATFSAFRFSPGPSSGTRYPPRAVGALAAAALVAQSALVVVWSVVGGAAVALPTACLLVALSAAALGVQTVLAKRLSGASGLTTTFVTGTLTSLMEGLADRRRGARVLQLAVVLALVTGAVAGTALVRAAPAVAPLLSAVLVAGATAVLLSSVRADPRSSE
jgi:uncharacterized membrane protein YoaK (UPF0700 family)